MKPAFDGPARRWESKTVRLCFQSVIRNNGRALLNILVNIALCAAVYWTLGSGQRSKGFEIYVADRKQVSLGQRVKNRLAQGGHERWTEIE